MQSLISVADLNKELILEILALSEEFKNGLVKSTLSGKVIASCFFESSTRTRLSFESAVARLGGTCMGFADSNATSLAGKGESLVDTLKIISCYADALIIRHPADGAARLAHEVCHIPIINAGDGANQHPTQTLLDLFSIQSSQGKLDGIHLGIMGDLKFSRTVHSLIEAVKLFNIKLYFIAPKPLRMSEEQLLGLKNAGIEYSFHNALEEVVDQLDCLYLTRLQKERFLDEEIVDSYKITLTNLKNVKPNLKIFHPLPRREELPVEIDDTPYAYYFQQAQNGLYVRQALLDTFFSSRQ